MSCLIVHESRDSLGYLKKKKKKKNKSEYKVWFYFDENWKTIFSYFNIDKNKLLNFHRPEIFNIKTVKFRQNLRNQFQVLQYMPSNE